MVNADILIETKRLRFRPWADSDAVFLSYPVKPGICHLEAKPKDHFV